MTTPAPDLDLDERRRQYWGKMHGVAIRYGFMPKNLGGSAGLALAETAGAPVDPSVTADDIWAVAWQNAESADEWVTAFPAYRPEYRLLAKVPLQDGRVAVIFRHEARRDAGQVAS